LNLPVSLAIALFGILSWAFLFLGPWAGGHAREKADFLFDLRDRDEFDQGIRAYREAARWMPFSAQIHHDLGWNLLFRRVSLPEGGATVFRCSPADPGFAEGAAHLDRAIALNPLMGHFHEARAAVYRKAQQEEKALEEIDEAIRLHGAQGRYYRFRAEIHEAMGNDDQAAADRKAARIREEADRAHLPD
jgi:tetratricopeptide (TPR) repeat protein